MSITAGAIDSERSHHHHHKKFFHCKNDSGELDVFEAARYFSGYNEAVGFTQKIMREDHHRHLHGHRGRISLDMPLRSLLPQHFHGLEKHNGKDKKQKQPSSPGGRLASFLNSLFSQSASKKKKSKSKSTTTTQTMKDEDESPASGRRLRRSSISHFRSSSTTTADTKSLYSSLSSGFRTPPYVQTPTKSLKEFRNFSSDQKQNHQAVSKYNNNDHLKSTSFQNVSLWDDKRKRDRPNVLDENYKARNVVSDQKDRILVGEKRCAEEKEFKKFNNDGDDGGDSDSSSDLFELQNYDLGYYPSGLPVYETTNMDNIKRGAPISNGSL